MANGYSQIYGNYIEFNKKEEMNTIIVSGFILLIAIVGTLFIKYQDWHAERHGGAGTV